MHDGIHFNLSTKYLKTCSCLHLSGRRHKHECPGDGVPKGHGSSELANVEIRDDGRRVDQGLVREFGRLVEQEENIT
jgi:hypothetical protein